MLRPLVGAICGGCDERFDPAICGHSAWPARSVDPTVSDDLAASVVGRHLGGSNRADVEVLMRVGDAVRTRAVVRVTLA